MLLLKKNLKAFKYYNKEAEIIQAFNSHLDILTDNPYFEDNGGSNLVTRTSENLN